jgi:Ca2+-binding RTX toxin-like protein
MGKPYAGVYFPGATQGTDTLDARGSTQSWVIDGRGGDDIIYGGAEPDILFGNGGDDTLFGSPYDTVIDGGSGTDTVDFSLYETMNGLGVVARVFGGMLHPNLPDGSVVEPLNSLLNVENLIGSSYDDILAGGRAVNELYGGAGNDLLLARGAGDFLTGGVGTDIFDITGVSRTVTITDFHYNDGDRIQIEGDATFSWTEGMGKDADGNVEDAWIGTCDLLFGGTLQVIVLEADTTPSAGWIIG